MAVPLEAGETVAVLLEVVSETASFVTVPVVETVSSVPVKVAAVGRSNAPFVSLTY